MTGMHIAEWAGEVPGAVVAGSLYAVGPEQRLAAADALATGGCGIHTDVIVRADGSQRGVSLDELRRVRERMPQASIDVHLILDAETPAALAVLREVLDAAPRLGADKVTLAASAHRAVADRVTDLRRAGVAVWREVSPGATDVADGRGGGSDHGVRDVDGVLGSPGIHDVDGALVMLIPPGTTGTADATRIPVVSRLAAQLPVGVDGGVTGELAHASVAAGASFIVSGRALLRPADTSTERIPT